MTLLYSFSRKCLESGEVLCKSNRCNNSCQFFRCFHTENFHCYLGNGMGCCCTPSQTDRHGKCNAPNHGIMSTNFPVRQGAVSSCCPCMGMCTRLHCPPVGSRCQKTCGRS